MVRDCLLVLRKSNQVIPECLAHNSNTVSQDEYKWLGTAVYNLGYLFYKNSMFPEGAELLTLACEQFYQWCFKADGDATKDFSGNYLKVFHLRKSRLADFILIVLPCRLK